MVSLTHLKAPQQQLKILQLDFKEALTTRPKKAKNAPESVSQNGELNSSYHTILLTSSYFNISSITPVGVSWVEDLSIKLT